MFSTFLKKVEVEPVFKDNPMIAKTNYRPASLLLVIYKLYERLIYKQASELFEPILFRKSYSAPNCLLVMVGKWKKYLDKKGLVGYC